VSGHGKWPIVDCAGKEGPRGKGGVNNLSGLSGSPKGLQEQRGDGKLDPWGISSNGEGETKRADKGKGREEQKGEGIYQVLKLQKIREGSFVTLIPKERKGEKGSGQGKQSLTRGLAAKEKKGDPRWEERYGG